MQISELSRGEAGCIRIRLRFGLAASEPRGLAETELQCDDPEGIHLPKHHKILVGLGGEHGQGHQSRRKDVTSYKGSAKRSET